MRKKMVDQHRNRKHHNWLVYRIGDRFLEKYTPYYKGVLVDLGCGESPYKNFFLKYADSYIGVDWGGTIHQTKPDVISNLNENIALKNESVDTLVSISVMEHLSEPQRFLNECHRILKKDGTFILQVPWQWWIHEAPHDYFRYTPYGLKHLFEKAGFTDVKVEPQSGFFTMWILKFNYFTTRLIVGPRIARLLIRIFLLPLWFILQVIAPILDRLDRNWNLESAGYYVVAKKH